MELGEALGAVAALQQEGLAFRRAGELGRQAAGFAGKHQRRIDPQLLLDFLQVTCIRIVGHLLDRLAAPGVR